jgi:hypothetical protein
MQAGGPGIPQDAYGRTLTTPGDSKKDFPHRRAGK